VAYDCDAETRPEALGPLAKVNEPLYWQVGGIAARSAPDGPVVKTFSAFTCGLSGSSSYMLPHTLGDNNAGIPRYEEMRRRCAGTFREELCRPCVQVSHHAWTLWALFDQYQFCGRESAEVFDARPQAERFNSIDRLTPGGRRVGIPVADAGRSRLRRFWTGRWKG
jgi:hypothetical protein